MVYFRYNLSMIITIKEQTFNTKDITQLYPAAIVKTGYENETTQMSLEWLDIESKGKVEIDGFGIFIHLGEHTKHSFVYKTRDELESAIKELSLQLQKLESVTTL